ncbi:MAG: hypothetical protein JXQ73_01260 [Phycisphaerae bacterium]|nr:hypothetical protein [Phycisphaerae bacterium]
MDTHITGKCPHCKASYRLRVHAAGRRARCKTCKQVFVVPGEPLGKSVEEDVLGWLSRGEKDTLETEEDDEEGETDASRIRSSGLFRSDGKNPASRPIAS